MRKDKMPKIIYATEYGGFYKNPVPTHYPSEVKIAERMKYFREDQPNVVWNFNMNEAPKTGERIIVAIEGNTRSELAQWDGSNWRTIMAARDWTGHKVYAWTYLPAAPKQGD